MDFNSLISSEALRSSYFDVQVEGEELYFDYKLKHDVCTSMNASILMKKIGIQGLNRGTEEQRNRGTEEQMNRRTDEQTNR